VLRPDKLKLIDGRVKNNAKHSERIQALPSDSVILENFVSRRNILLRILACKTVAHSSTTFLSPTTLSVRVTQSVILSDAIYFWVAWTCACFHWIYALSSTALCSTTLLTCSCTFRTRLTEIWILGKAVNHWIVWTSNS